MRLSGSVALLAMSLLAPVTSAIVCNDKYAVIACYSFRGVLSFARCAQISWVIIPTGDDAKYLVRLRW